MEDNKQLGRDNGTYQLVQEHQPLNNTEQASYNPATQAPNDELDLAEQNRYFEEKNIADNEHNQRLMQDKQEVIHELAGEKEEMIAQVESLREQLEEARKVIKSKERRIKSMDKNLSISHSQLKQGKQQVDELQAQVEQTTGAIEDSRPYALLKHESIEKDQRIRELEDRIRTVENENEGMKADNERRLEQEAIKERLELDYNNHVKPYVNPTYERFVKMDMKRHITYDKVVSYVNDLGETLIDHTTQRKMTAAEFYKSHFLKHPERAGVLAVPNNRHINQTVRDYQQVSSQGESNYKEDPNAPRGVAVGGYVESDYYEHEGKARGMSIKRGAITFVNSAVEAQEEIRVNGPKYRKGRKDGSAILKIAGWDPKIEILDAELGVIHYGY